MHLELCKAQFPGTATPESQQCINHRLLTHLRGFEGFLPLLQLGLHALLLLRLALLLLPADLLVLRQKVLL